MRLAVRLGIGLTAFLVVLSILSFVAGLLRIIVGQVVIGFIAVAAGLLATKWLTNALEKRDP